MLDHYKDNNAIIPYDDIDIDIIPPSLVGPSPTFKNIKF